MAEVTTAPSGRFGRGVGGPKAVAPGVPFEAFWPTPPFPPIGSLTAIPPFALRERSLRSAVIRPSDEGLGPAHRVSRSPVKTNAYYIWPGRASVSSATSDRPTWMGYLRSMLRACPTITPV